MMSLKQLLVGFVLACAMVSTFGSVASAQLFPFPFPGFGASPDDSRSAGKVEKLLGLNANAKAVSVSGISAGAFMATQLQVAYSASIMGVGSIAGGPWNCSDGSSMTAQTTCMYVTSQVNPPSLISQLKKVASRGEVDSLDHLKTTRVYLYNSPADQVVREPMNEKTKAFYAAFVPEAQIKTETSVQSAHGFPTLNYGQGCGSMGSPYINNCNFDAAGELFKQIYNTSALASQKAVASSLHVFDQSEFANSDTMLDRSGWVYIPEKCRVAGAHCAVHVALHGCLQSGEAIGDVFAVHAGYNEWAEGSNIIVLYPQAVKGSGNPNACFDWWGYTGQDYATKTGPQMKAIKAMIDRVLGS
jgi:hypothetical protein